MRAETVMARIVSRRSEIIALFVGNAAAQYEELRRIFGEMRWHLAHASSWRRALCLPELPLFTHFVYEHTPGDLAWIAALEDVQGLRGAPAFILTTRTGGQELWSEVLNRGGYDVLLEPFDLMEVARVIRAARKHSLRQCASPAMAATEY